MPVPVATDQDNDSMRRANRASSGARSTQRTTHLDLSSADDVVAGRTRKPKTSWSSVAAAVLCGLATFGTLLYASRRVFSSGGAMTAGRVARKAVDAGPRATPQHLERTDLPPDSIYRTKVRDIHGNRQDFAQFAGSVSLVVNVACE